MAMLTVHVKKRTWMMTEPFVISRGTQTDVPVIVVTIIDERGFVGRGEACGITYEGETPETMEQQIAAAMPQLEMLASREALLSVLPPGGARCAIDAALWDLEAKRSGIPAWRAAGLAEMKPVVTALTIGIRSLAEYRARAEACSAYPLLKVKVDDREPLEAVRAVRQGSPQAKLIVDSNQSWSVERLQALASPLCDLGVVLLEQPIAVGQEHRLRGWRSPIPLAADELIRDENDLCKAAGRFDVINIKLDKCGGLTAALELAESATARGLELMVGCMAGSSLCMAPALILAQRCRFIDLDGPLLQAEDWPEPLRYTNGVIDPPAAPLWG